MEKTLRSPGIARGSNAATGILLLVIAAAGHPCPARAQAPQALRSPEVHADHRPGSGPRRWRCAPKRSSPAFRFRAPNAREVFLAREGAPRQPMQKDEQGVWSITTDPLEPDLYGYSFVADDVTLFDPSNPVIKPNLLFTSSAVHVPGPASLPWEINDVPHGTVHQHFYKSGVVGDERDFYVVSSG